MKLLLILLGVYVYFVVGELTIKILNRFFPESLQYDEWDEGAHVIWRLLQPLMVVVCIGIAIFKTKEIKLPKIDIPFTPKKVADLICKIDLKKLVKYRIRIEPKKVEKVGRPAGSPGCFGKYEVRFHTVKGCYNCKHFHNCLGGK